MPTSPGKKWTFWLALVCTQPVTALATNFDAGINQLYFQHWEPLYEAAQSRNNAVRKDLTEGVASDFNTARQKIEQANVRAQAYADEQTPPGMPCGGDNCTGQQAMSAVIAGSGGVLGAANPVSGTAAQATRTNEAIITPQGAFGALVTDQVQCGKFASQAEIRAGVCPGAAVSPKPNADLAGATLLAEPAIGTNEAHPNLDAQARSALIHNLTDTMPTARLKKPNYQTAAGEAAAGLQMSMQTRMNLAQTILSQVAAGQTPIKRFGPQVQKTLGKSFTSTPPLASNASLEQALAWEDKATYGNPQWYVQLQALHSAAAEKQALLMMAEQLQQDYLKFRMDTTIQAALATQLAQQTQADMRLEVVRQDSNVAK